MKKLLGYVLRVLLIVVLIGGLGLAGAGVTIPLVYFIANKLWHALIVMIVVLGVYLFAFLVTFFPDLKRKWFK